MFGPVAIAEATAASIAAGAINSVSGGGTLITFPCLLGLGMNSIWANATSTVALWPGVIGSMWGYRGELKDARKWAALISLPSLLGGATGALLLLHTSSHEFSHIAPYLVLGATFLFMINGAISNALRRMTATSDGTESAAFTEDLPAHPTWTAGYIGFQFLVAVYGGYFGAGIGILMLAALGIMGLRNIHRMNGVKAWGAFCINGVAVGIFAINHIVDWRVALCMAVGSVAGGYFGARMARRVSQTAVRHVIILVGISAAISLFFHNL